MKTAIRIAQFILIFCIILSCVTIAYADVDTAHNIIASAEPTEPVASEFVMMEELFTSTIERIDGVTMYAPEEPQELTPPIAIMKPDVSVEMPTEPEPLAPPIAPEHKCCGATVYYPATCTQDGYYESVCDCGNTYREEFPATGHDWGDWHTTKLMTFTPGSMLRECKNCGMKNTHCIDMAPFSNYDKVESEILLPPNVIEITEQKTDGYNIYAKGIVHEIEDFP